MRYYKKKVKFSSTRFSSLMLSRTTNFPWMRYLPLIYSAFWRPTLLSSLPDLSLSVLLPLHLFIFPWLLIFLSCFSLYFLFFSPLFVCILPLPHFLLFMSLSFPEVNFSSVMSDSVASFPAPCPFKGPLLGSPGRYKGEGRIKEDREQRNSINNRPWKPHKTGKKYIRKAVNIRIIMVKNVRGVAVTFKYYIIDI